MGDAAVNFGGPVALDGLISCFRARPLPNGKSVMGNVYVSGELKVLEGLLKKKEARLKLYLGHAGWAPGQLQGGRPGQLDPGAGRRLHRVPEVSRCDLARALEAGDYCR